MADSLTQLGGLKVGAEDFLAAVLETAAHPIWVVDCDDLIRFANPAAIAALGYDSEDELIGRQSHETIHYAHPDGSPYPASECPMLLPRATGETVARDIDWFFRRDRSTFPVAYVSVPIDMPDGRGAVVAFTDIEDRLRSEQVLRDHDAILAEEQASLRRLAALAAGGAPSAQVFAAVARPLDGESMSAARQAAAPWWSPRSPCRPRGSDAHACRGRHAAGEQERRLAQ